MAAGEPLARPRGAVALWLGRVAYEAAWELQRRLVRARLEERVPDLLLLLEHPHTYTLGRAARPEHVLWDEARLRRAGVQVFRVERGGDVTYHGPGQLVGYPILSLRSRGLDAHRYLRDLEEVLLQALADLGVPAERRPPYTGVWCRGGKIAAIGVKFTRWVSWHGFALNVDPDLSYFEGIVPCGLPVRAVTSIRRELGRPVAAGRVRETVIGRFGQVFGLQLEPAPDGWAWLTSAGWAAPPTHHPE